MSRLLPRIGAVLVALAVPALSIAAPAQAASVDIDLITVNDFHGRLETIGAVGGAAVLAGAANEFRASNPNTLFAGSGDLIGASTFTSFIQDDNPTMDALNASGLSISSVGNHEYDQGWSDLRDDVIGGSDGHAADWPYLAANVVLKSTGEPAPETPPYEIVETGGVRVGFIGAVTEDLPSLVSPDGIVDLEVLPVVESVNRYADQLSDGDESNGEAEVVILLVHEDAQGEIEEGANANIDIIVAGHTHETYAYQQGAGSSVPGRPVIQTGQYATNVGHINLAVDVDSGEITFNAVENLPLMTCDAGGVCTPNYEPDPEVQQIVDDAVALAEELGSLPLGNITRNITRAFDVVDGEDGPILAEDRGEESTLGNLVADAQRSATDDLPTGPAQIAFMNPGGLRSDLCYAEAEYEAGLNACVGVPDEGGLITYKDAANVQPFANTLVRMTLTGTQIMAALQEQLQPVGASRPFLHLGVSDGFEYTYDITRDETGAPTAFTVTSMMLNGVEIDDGATYEVVVNSFLAAGGDNFLTFTEGTNRADTGQIDLESFVVYMGEFTPVAPDLQERAIDSSLLGEAAIHWPASLGDPPHIEAGTSEEFSLDTNLPIALPEDFTFTVDAPAGVTIEYGTRTSARSFPVTIPGLPAGESSLPITVTVTETAAPGDYELVFTLDRDGEFSVFDGNPLPTPQSLTVPLTINPVGLPPTGATTTWFLVAGLGAMFTGGLLIASAARRRRQVA